MSRPSFRGRYVEVKRATRTRRRALVPEGRVLLALDDVIEIDGALWFPVIHHGQMHYVKTKDVRLIGRLSTSKKKTAPKKTAPKKTTSKKKAASKKKASHKSGKRVAR